MRIDSNSNLEFCVPALYVYVIWIVSDPNRNFGFEAVKFGFMPRFAHHCTIHVHYEFRA